MADTNDKGQIDFMAQFKDAAISLKDRAFEILKNGADMYCDVKPLSEEQFVEFKEIATKLFSDPMQKLYADLGISLTRNETLFEEAAHCRHPQAVEFLMQYASPEDKGKAFNYAFAMDCTESIRILIKNGADVNEVKFGSRPLHRAESAKAVDILLEAGADINAVSGEGESPINYTLKYGSADVAWALLNKGAKIDKITLVNAASRSDGAPIVKHLLDVGKFDKETISEAASEAVRECVGAVGISKETMNLFLDCGINISGVNVNSWPLVHYAVFNQNPDVLETLLERGADANGLTKGSFPQTPLFLCVRMIWPKDEHEDHANWKKNLDEKMKCIDLLLEHGADLNADPDNSGYSPFFVAIQHGVVEVVQKLLEKGGDHGAINKPDSKGRTPLQHAAFNGNLNMVNFLIEQGADINAANEYGETAAHWAAFIGHVKMFDRLKEAGANMNAKTTEGRTPVDYAQLNNYLVFADNSIGVQDSEVCAA